ncbi:MAG: hypothetical protein WCC21_02260 [Candidatus Acidiferrales bacterium]
MSNTFDFETMAQIEALSKELGGLGECKRLGFIVEDEQGITGLTVAGLGYLLYVRAGAIRTLAEAFAAGFQCAHEETSSGA